MNIEEYKKAINNNKKIQLSSIIDIKREPTHAGEILEEEFLKPLGLSQSRLAKEIGVSVRAINEIVNKKRGITPEMAIKLAKRFGTTPEFWLGLQMNYDLWRAYNKPNRRFKRKTINSVSL